MIMLQTSKEDIDSLRAIIETQGFPEPNIKISVYKNRRGRYKDILLWCSADRSTCRFEPLFVTNYQYELQDIEELKIKVTPNMQASAF